MCVFFLFFLPPVLYLFCWLHFSKRPSSGNQPHLLQLPLGLGLWVSEQQQQQHQRASEEAANTGLSRGPPPSGLFNHARLLCRCLGRQIKIWSNCHNATAGPLKVRPPRGDLTVLSPFSASSPLSLSLPRRPSPHFSLLPRPPLSSFAPPPPFFFF